MSSDNTIEITDRAAFPGRITALRDATVELRAAALGLKAAVDKATEEAGSFTVGGPAPVYGEILDGLAFWHTAAVAATKSLCDSADNCADTVEAKFTGITGVDDEVARGIQGLGIGGSGGGWSLPSAGTDADSDSSSSLADLEKQIGAKVGVAYMPLFGEHPEMKTEGDLQSGDAWSTIKTPMALAVLRENGGEITPDITAAMTSSSNDAAARMWASLGDPETAAGKVEAVLRDAGDTATVVNAVKDTEFSAFGQTQWALADQLRFMAHVQSDPEGVPLLDLMTQVTDDQQWGLGQLDGSAFKGGWGPSGAGDAYLTRQMGIVEGPGGPYAVAIMAAPDSGSFSDSKVDMSEISRWLDLER